jgi:hypothetical protein
MVVHAVIPASGRIRHEDLKSQPGLNGEFQASLGYTV